MARWIYVFTAVSLIVVALTGFIPDSLQKIALVRAGHRPPFPLAPHFHAALMGSFLLLLLVQTMLHQTVLMLDLILLFQLRVGILFPLLILIGLRARTTELYMLASEWWHSIAPRLMGV